MRSVSRWRGLEPLAELHLLDQELGHQDSPPGIRPCGPPRWRRHRRRPRHPPPPARAARRQRRRPGRGGLVLALGGLLCVLRNAEDLLDRQAAQLGDVLGLAQAAQARHRRLDLVDRVVRADRLGEHVADPAQLEHGADAAAGDHAGSLAGRAQDDVAGAEAADDAVGKRLPVLGHPDQVLAGVLDGLLDRQRDLAGLAVADPDDVVLVADGDQGGEREPPAALDDLGDAVDLDHPLLQVEALRADSFDVCAHLLL